MKKEVLDLKLSKFKLDAKLKELKDRVGMIIQSLLFPVDKYTISKAKKWAALNGFKTDKVSQPEDGNCIHLTQKLPGRFNTYKTMLIGKDVMARVAGNMNSRFAGSLSLKSFSKFAEIKSDMDIQIPMKAELRFLCDGPNRDGEITREDLEESLGAWGAKEIIDFHDMEDMANPTAYKLSDVKGYLGTNLRLENIDGKWWILADAEIMDRSLAYHLYLKEQKGEPLEVSAEYGWNNYYVNGKKFQININPHLICIIPKGHIEGNKITIAS